MTQRPIQARRTQFLASSPALRLVAPTQGQTPELPADAPDAAGLPDAATASEDSDSARISDSYIRELRSADFVEPMLVLESELVDFLGFGESAPARSAFPSVPPPLPSSPAFSHYPTLERHPILDRYQPWVDEPISMPPLCGLFRWWLMALLCL